MPRPKPARSTLCAAKAWHYLRPNSPRPLSGPRPWPAADLESESQKHKWAPTPGRCNRADIQERRRPQTHGLDGPWRPAVKHRPCMIEQRKDCQFPVDQERSRRDPRQFTKQRHDGMPRRGANKKPNLYGRRSKPRWDWLFVNCMQRPAIREKTGSMRASSRAAAYHRDPVHTLSRDMTRMPPAPRNDPIPIEKGQRFGTRILAKSAAERDMDHRHDQTGGQ